MHGILGEEEVGYGKRQGKVRFGGVRDRYSYRRLGRRGRRWEGSVGGGGHEDEDVVGRGDDGRMGGDVDSGRWKTGLERDRGLEMQMGMGMEMEVEYLQSSRPRLFTAVGVELCPAVRVPSAATPGSPPLADPSSSRPSHDPDPHPSHLPSGQSRELVSASHRRRSFAPGVVEGTATTKLAKIGIYTAS
nr:hypothetical protein CFP56_02956 [Quercus suber]